jgi:hypothetical protein
VVDVDVVAADDMVVKALRLAKRGVGAEHGRGGGARERRELP